VTSYLALGRIALWYGTFALLKRVVPLRTLARWAWGSARGRKTAAHTPPLAIALRRRAGTRGNCLQWALVVYRELAHAGANPTLVAGVAREGTETVGHAWVEVRGRPVAEPDEETTRFLVIARFGEQGRLLPTSSTAA
jgi:hypothetical protein